MKKLFRKSIEIIADKAVKEVEEEFGRGKGEDKKKKAIEFIVGCLPVPAFAKSITVFLLDELIDESVEFAVRKMNVRKI